MKRSVSLRQAKGLGARFRCCSTVDTAALQLLLLFAISALGAAESYASERTAAEQLARMADALRSLSYSGTAVYLHGNKLEALRVMHRVEDGQVREEIVSLNGPVRTLTREKGRVTCELSKSRPISVPGHGIGTDLLKPWALDFELLNQHYGVHALGSARVAGRQTDVIGIIPGDDLRYGYRFYLDRKTGLPLKSDLMGQQPDPIEQIMFTSLELFPDPGPVVAAEVSSSPAPAQPQARDSDLDGLDWRLDGLPPGFVLSMHNERLDDTGKPVEHFLLWDGLASVSVYVESDTREGLKGSARIGSVHAAGDQLAARQVTVVGEVPLKTVQVILAGIRYLPEPQP